MDAMTGTPWELKAPHIVGVNLTGVMDEWTTPKDLILHLAGKLTVRVRLYLSSCTGFMLMRLIVCRAGQAVSSNISGQGWSSNPAPVRVSQPNPRLSY